MPQSFSLTASGPKEQGKQSITSWQALLLGGWLGLLRLLVLLVVLLAVVAFAHDMFSLWCVVD